MNNEILYVLLPDYAGHEQFNKQGFRQTNIR